MEASYCATTFPGLAVTFPGSAGIFFFKSLTIALSCTDAQSKSLLFCNREYRRSRGQMLKILNLFYHKSIDLNIYIYIVSQKLHRV